MSDNLDMILNALSSGDRQKNEAIIKAFLATPDGKQIAGALSNMTSDDLANLIDSAPKNKLKNILSDSQKLQNILNDPKAMEKIKRKLR